MCNISSSGDLKYNKNNPETQNYRDYFFYGRILA